MGSKYGLGYADVRTPTTATFLKGADMVLGSDQRYFEQRLLFCCSMR